MIPVDKKFVKITQAVSVEAFRNFRDMNAVISAGTGSGRIHGLSSDNLSRVGIGLESEVSTRPYDRDDLNACERVYVLATDDMRERMSPALTQWRIDVASYEQDRLVEKQAREKFEAEKVAADRKFATDLLNSVRNETITEVPVSLTSLLNVYASNVLNALDDDLNSGLFSDDEAAEIYEKAVLALKTLQ